MATLEVETQGAATLEWETLSSREAARLRSTYMAEPLQSLASRAPGR